MPDDESLLQSLRATFRLEADEHLQAIASGLLALEKSPPPEEQHQLVETIFRAAHSLKSAARAVNFFDVESICETLEDIFAGWRRHDSEPSPPLLDSLHRSLDLARQALEAHQASMAPEVAIPAAAAAPQASVPVAPEIPPSMPSSADTVRIAVEKLDAGVLEAEEMLTAKLTAAQRAADLATLTGQFEGWRKEWLKTQPDVRVLRQFSEKSAATADVVPQALTRLVDFFDWSHDYLRMLESNAATFQHAAEQDHLVVAKLVDDLLEHSKKLVMLPMATQGALFQKIVRDLGREQEKEVDLVLRGEDAEIDKRILEEMKDPLVHLLRNCVDHGIEKPEERRRLGKPSRATIALSVLPLEGDKIELLVSDDGSGIDVEKVKAHAVKSGRLSAVDALQLSPAQAHGLIFHSGVSTSPMITQVSGRGLGLAIVKEKAEKLGGEVSVESQPGIGTTFRMRLPIALSTFRGILVEAARRLFVVPTTQAERVGRFRREDVRTVEGRETLALDGRATSLVRLADVLELPDSEQVEATAETTPMMLLGAGEQRVAFAVDAVHGEQEVLVKRLGKPLVRIRNISGATILGSGRVVPILNVTDLLKSVRKTGGVAPHISALRAAAIEQKAILVAEDSITSRMLLKGILESAGYRVKTAVDGLEAFTSLRAERFDLLISDVEMPRLNGFDLTARVRADRRLAELPVILVTALASREDQERGVDVGANAYLVKSSFDQSNLLEAVRRLV